MDVRKLWELLKATVTGWLEDKASRLAAALSYYTVLSLPPILLIVVAVAGLVWGRQGVQDALAGQAAGLVGEQAGALVTDMIEGASASLGSGILATVVGIGTLLFGATGAFAQLQESLNTIWEVRADPDSGMVDTIKKRVLSFGMVIVLAFLLLVSLVVSAALAAVGKYLEGLMPDLILVAQALSFFLSFVVVTFLFALIFKYLPDVKINWRDVWLGAAVTAFFFTVGKFLIGLYLGQSSTASGYGTAGALVLILLWVYYSAQILFFGAEFTQVYARMFGSRIVPDENAVPLTKEERAEQGIPHMEAGEDARGPALPVDVSFPVSGAQLAAPVAVLPPPPVGNRPSLVRLFAGAAVFVTGLVTGIVVNERREKT